MSLTPARAAGRDRQVAGLGHAGAALGPGVLRDQDVVGRDLELGGVDARREILEVLEHDRPALVLEQPLIRRRALEDGAARREAAEQRDQAADPRRSAGRATGPPAIDPVRLTLQTCAERLARDRSRLQVQHRLELAQHGAEPAGREQVLHVVRPGRLEIDQHRGLLAQLVEALQRHFDPRPPGDRGEVQDAVGRAADREQHQARSRLPAGVTICVGLGPPSRASATARMPLASPARSRSACTAGIVAVPGRSCRASRRCTPWCSPCPSPGRCPRWWQGASRCAGFRARRCARPELGPKAPAVGAGAKASSR